MKEKTWNTINIIQFKFKCNCHCMYDWNNKQPMKLYHKKNHWHFGSYENSICSYKCSKFRGNPHENIPYNIGRFWVNIRMTPHTVVVMRSRTTKSVLQQLNSWQPEGCLQLWNQVVAGFCHGLRVELDDSFARWKHTKLRPEKNLRNINLLFFSYTRCKWSHPEAKIVFSKSTCCVLSRFNICSE